MKTNIVLFALAVFIISLYYNAEYFLPGELSE